MKIVYSLVVYTLSCALHDAAGYPFPYYPYSNNMDSLSFGSSDSSRGGLVYSRYYNPNYNPRTVGGGMAAFMFRQPEDAPSEPQQSQYYLPDRRRQTDNYAPSPQQNEVFYPQSPERPYVTEATEIADPTERTEILSTTVKAIVPELNEPEIEEIEEPVQKAKKRVSKKKPVKKPVEDEEEEEEEGYAPRLPTGAFFPMFFGWGGRSSGGGPGGATAIANAYSTGRGGVASSHATAYGVPRPDSKL